VAIATSPEHAVDQQTWHGDMLAWWFQVGAAILGTSIVLTLTINQLLLARRDNTGDDRPLPPRESRLRLQQLVSGVPRDVISILAIVLLAVVAFVAVPRVMFHSGTGASVGDSARSADGPISTPGPRIARILNLPDSAFSPLPKDFSINQPPWCPACRRHTAAHRRK